MYSSSHKKRGLGRLVGLAGLEGAGSGVPGDGDGESGAGEDVARLRKRCQRVFRYSRNEAYLFRFLLHSRRLLPDMGGVLVFGACVVSPKS